MNGSKFTRWLAIAAACAVIGIGVALLPAPADGSPCGTCSSTVHSATGSGQGASCAEAGIAARNNAIQNAASSNPSCIPCAMNVVSTSCVASSWTGTPPANPYSSSTSITYRCDVCSGGPSM